MLFQHAHKMKTVPTQMEVTPVHVNMVMKELAKTVKTSTNAPTIPIHATSIV